MISITQCTDTATLASIITIRTNLCSFNNHQSSIAYTSGRPMLAYHIQGPVLLVPTRRGSFQSSRSVSVLPRCNCLDRLHHCLYHAVHLTLASIVMHQT